MRCHAKKLRQFSLWLQEVMEIRGASAAESAPDPPPLHRGSSSLSPRNPTPGQATGTEQGNARNPLNTLAHCFARSRPYGDVKNAAGSKVSHHGGRAAGPG